MRFSQTENIQEHSIQVAIVAHALALMNNKYFAVQTSPERVALVAIFHDASEVITGDLPTPVKYFNQDIKKAYKDIEAHAYKQLLHLLPKDLTSEYEELLIPGEKDNAHQVLIKAADVLCAYIKCLEEQAAGNQEFLNARKSLEDKLTELNCPEANYFMEHFINGYSLTLDELSAPLRDQ